MNSNQETLQLFKALGDQTRLQILETLISKENMCVQDLAEVLRKDQSTIFRHLKILEQSKLITSTKENKYLICCICKKNKILRLIDQAKKILEC